MNFFLMIRPPPTSTLFPYTTLFRPSLARVAARAALGEDDFAALQRRGVFAERSEEHTSELQSLRHLVCRLLLEKKKGNWTTVGMRKRANEIGTSLQL